MRRTNFSAAFIIAFVLTSSMESFRQSMIISDSGLMIFLALNIKTSFHMHLFFYYWPRSVDNEGIISLLGQGKSNA